MKKKVAIVFGITDNYTFALANVLIGMKNHCSRFWDNIIVFHDGITEENQNNISKIYPCEFKYFNLDKISKKVNKESLKLYSYLTISRFECFDLLDNYEYVIWHDVDILIQKDFSELLYAADKSGFALTCNPEFRMEQNFYGLPEGYDLLKPLYNAGLMVLRDTLPRYETMREYCYRKFNEYSSMLRYFDQAILNMLIQDYKVTVGQISLENYCCHPANINYKNAAIIHAYGVEKFWNSTELKIQFPEWESNDDEWNRISKGEKRVTAVIYNSEPIKPEISVVMSIYKRIDFVDDAIQSILEQSYHNFELLIVIEKTNRQQTIKSYIENKFPDKRIKVICNDINLGFAESLNVGIDEARGKYIARMDDDDISLPYRFEREIEFLESHRDISIVGSFIKMFMNCNNLCTVPATHEELRIRALTETPFYHSTVMFRKKDFEDKGLRYDAKYKTEDFDLWCRAVDKVKFANIQEVLLMYRASGTNVTVKDSNDVINSHVSIVQRNFKEHLGLDFSYDEVILIEQPEVLNCCYNSIMFTARRNELLNVLNKTNSKLKVYDNNLFEDRFKRYRQSFTMWLTIRLRNHKLLLKSAKLCYGIISKKGEYSYIFHKDVKKGKNERKSI